MIRTNSSFLGRIVEPVSLAERSDNRGIHTPKYLQYHLILARSGLQALGEDPQQQPISAQGKEWHRT
jgi:hypothetical protein